MKFIHFLSQRFKKYFLYIPIVFICGLFLVGIAIGDFIFFNLKLYCGLCVIFYCVFSKNKCLKLSAIYLFALFYGVCCIHRHLLMIPANLEGFVGETVVNGFVKDVSYKNSKTSIILYEVELEDSNLNYDNLIKLSYKRKINVIQDQKVRTKVSLEIPENFDSEFDYVDYLRKKGIYLIGDGDNLEIIDHKQTLVYLLSKLKNTIVSRVRRVYSEPEASLLLGLVTGYRADFDKSFDEQLSKTGTTHIIAISGFNISLLITLILGFVQYIGKRMGMLLALGLSIIFCILTGACPSIVRATIMAIVVLIGKELGRESIPSILLLLTAAVMAFFNPFILWDISFQLSFLSTIGLVYFFPIFELLFKKNSHFEPISSTAGTFVTTLPVIVSTFGQFSILVFISNLLVLSMVSLSTILGLINTVLLLFNIKLGLIFSFINYLPLHYIVWMIETLSKSPVNIINVNFNIKPLHIFIYYLILFIFILYKDFKLHLSEGT